MTTLLSTLTAKPGQGATLEKILREMVQHTAREPGAVCYDLLRPEDGRADTLVVYERYRDADAKATHLSSTYLRDALERAAPILAAPPKLENLTPLACIRHEWTTVEGRAAEVLVLPIGPVSLVYARTERGLLACGAIDPAALERFGIPAARVRPTTGNSIGSLDDLLAGEVREANAPAQALGIVAGMRGRDAFARL